MVLALLLVQAAVVIVQALKLYAVFAAIRWVIKDGPQYRRGIESLREDPTEVEWWRLVADAPRARFFPFGAMDYKVVAWTARSPRVIKTPLRVARGVFFDLIGIVIWFALGLLALGLALDAGQAIPPEWTWVPAASITLMTFQFILIAAEAMFSYAKIGSYGRGFHRATRYRSSAQSSMFLQEFYVLAGTVIMTTVANTASFFFLRAQGSLAFATDVVISHGSATVEDLFSSIYAAVMCFLLVFPPSPLDMFGQFVILLVTVQGAAILLLVLSTLGLATPLGQDRRADLMPGPEPRTPRDEREPDAPISTTPTSRYVLKRVGHAVGGVFLLLFIGKALGRRLAR
jgi:hypothetical protein